MKLAVLSLLLALGLFYLPNSIKDAQEASQGLIIREIDKGFNSYSLGTRTITGYSSTIDQCDSDPFITASGTEVRYGIAACPRDIPFGTKIKIDGKTYICEDRLNKKYDDRFDIWFPSRREALDYGLQQKEVIIIE